MKADERVLAQYAREQQERLSAWQTPADFEAVVEEIRDGVGAYTLFRKPMWSYWRDAWTLGRFAHLIGAEAVQLATMADQYPDGRVRIGSRITDVEVTEAMMPGRRRANEFAPDASRSRFEPGEELAMRAAALPQVLDGAIRKKAGKQYHPPPTLLVYLNLGTYSGSLDRLTRGTIADVKARYAHSFASIYVLRGNELL